MPGSATLTLQQAMLSHTLAYGPLTAPSAIYIGLCTTSPAPTAGTGGAEISGGGYVRMLAAFALAGSNIAANLATVEWAPATADWGSVGYFELWSAPTGSSGRLYWGPLVDPADRVTQIVRNVFRNDIMRVSAGALQVSVA